MATSSSTRPGIPRLSTCADGRRSKSDKAGTERDIPAEQENLRKRTMNAVPLRPWRENHARELRISRTITAPARDWS
jgi:hypothetical protein